MKEITKEEFRKFFYPLLMDHDCHVTEPDGEYSPETEWAIDDIIDELFANFDIVRKTEDQENSHS